MAGDTHRVCRQPKQRVKWCQGEGDLRGRWRWKRLTCVFGPAGVGEVSPKVIGGFREQTFEQTSHSALSVNL